MKKISVYTMEYCPYCENAKRLLTKKSIPFEEIKVSEDDDAAWDRLEKLTGYKTMPQIFIGEKFIGGYAQLVDLEKSDQLNQMLKD